MLVYSEAALLLIMGRTGIIFERLHDRPVSIELRMSGARIRSIEFLVVILAFAGCLDPGEQIRFFWRTRPMVASTYCLLPSVHRIRCNYDDLVQNQANRRSKRHTPLTLIIADECGAAPAGLTVDGSTWIRPLPVIVRLDGNTPETGAFQLVIAVSKIP